MSDDKNRRAALDAAVTLSDVGDEPAEVIERAESYLAWLEPPAVKAVPNPWRARGAAKTKAAATQWLAFDETHLFKPEAFDRLFKPGASYDEWIYCGPPLKPGGAVGKPADRPERVIPLPKRDPETGADVEPEKYFYFRAKRGGRLYRVQDGAGRELSGAYWHPGDKSWHEAVIWRTFDDLRNSPNFTEVTF